jgi:hypothetical protein
MASKTMQDRLQKARLSRVTKVTIAGTELALHKWTLDQSLKHSAFLFDLLKLGIKDTRAVSVSELLKLDWKEIISKYGTQLKGIAAETVETGNFENMDEAVEWVNAIPIDEFMNLLMEIWKGNLLPLATNLGLVNKAIPSVPVPAEAQKT